MTPIFLPLWFGWALKTRHKAGHFALFPGDCRNSQTRWRREGDLNRRDPSKSRALPRFRGICDSPEITSALVRLLLWLGDGFDPEAFSIDKVNGQLAPLQDARVKPAAGKK